MVASRNSRNQRVLSRPMQLLVQMQWWSNRAMHLRQCSQGCVQGVGGGWVCGALARVDGYGGGGGVGVW